jgi:WXXGXW repeat (2 copies)
MKSFRSQVFALMLGAALPTYLVMPLQAQIAIGVTVEIAPPPLPYYEQPIIPAEGYLWVPGYWAWDPAEGDYYWVPGTWVEPPQPELLWTPAYWGWEGGRYFFHPGYWGREVGFYGGIDYGFGYTGEGYFGGHWDHGAFFYNRTVNNITNVRITNVYNKTVIVNNTVNRVSFNGGNGGTTVRPTPQQEAFAHEKHVEATTVQRQHAETASKDRSLFAKQNHGEPAVAATQRAGVLQGEGVTHASRTPVAPAALPAGRAQELPRPGQEPPRANETGHELPAGHELPKVEEKAAEPRREPQETPRAEPPRPAEANREPPKLEARPEPRSEPRIEERRPEERPVEPPKAEERKPAAPAQAERAPAAHAPPPPHVAPPPHPPAPHPNEHQEERK